jgi:hypothetical protein
MATAIDAKGDLIAGTGADTFARLAVGTNGHTLVADSAEATGLKWAAPSSGALTLIKSQTIGSAVSSITVSDVFSSTYDNYCIILSGGVASVNNWITLQLGSTTSGYYAVTHYSSANQSSALGVGSENGSNFTYAGAGSADSLNSFIILEAPNLAKKTSFFSRAMRTSTTANYSTAIIGSGFENSTTQHTAFTLSGSDVGSGAGTFTGGTIKVYGYQN